MITRRTFITRLCGGLVATAVIAKIPVELIPQPVQYRAAIDYLLKHYRIHMKGKSSSDSPRYGYVGAELYAAYESELMPIERWVSVEDTRRGYHSLMFKGIALRKSTPGWFVKFANEHDNWRGNPYRG